MKVMVIGAGIGGLTAALSLHAAGMDTQVYKSVADIRALGVGINLQPNAVRELIELGFADALAATGIETTVLGYYNKHGQLIWAEPRGRAAGYEWPQYAISRGDLQMILLMVVKERIGVENVLAGHHLISFEQDGSRRHRAIHRPEDRQGAPGGARRRFDRLRRHPFDHPGSSIRQRDHRHRGGGNRAASSKPNPSWMVERTSPWASTTAGRWSIRSARRSLIAAFAHKLDECAWQTVSARGARHMGSQGVQGSVLPPLQGLEFQMDQVRRPNLRYR